MNLQNSEHSVLQLVRKQSPLIHNITNYVVMNWTANCLLAVGASPVMAHAEEEVQEMTGHAQALLINIGTLSSPWLKAMALAMCSAKDKGIPIVFDPVGVGATQFRTQEALALLRETNPSVIRGNPSEILALAGVSARTKGVSSIHSPEFAIDAAHQLREQFNCVVCISGPVDYTISDEILECHYGHEIMTSVTGMGCAASAMIAAFCAVENSHARAAHEAMTLMGSVGEKAQRESSGTGSFQVKFLDTLYGVGR